MALITESEQMQPAIASREPSLAKGRPSSPTLDTPSPESGVLPLLHEPPPEYDKRASSPHPSPAEEEKEKTPVRSSRVQYGTARDKSLREAPAKIVFHQGWPVPSSLSPDPDEAR